MLNAATVETSRGLRLTKERQSLKIDGCVALSFAIVAAELSGPPLVPSGMMAEPFKAVWGNCDPRRVTGAGQRRILVEAARVDAGRRR